MAEPSPPSEQTSILDLSHIAAAIYPDLASDFARLADFPVPVPELAPVVEPLKRIEAWSREQTSHRDSCRNLLHDALKLVVLISERSRDGPTDSSELSPAIEQTVASILDINDNIDIWAHIPRRMSSRWQPTIEATITEHEENLKNILDHLSGEVTLPEYDGVATSEWKVKEGSVDHWVPSEDMEEPVHGDSQPGLSGVVENSLTSEVPETPDDQPPVLSHSPNPTSQGHENVTPSIDALKLDHPVNEGSSNVSDMEKWAKFVTVVPGQHGRFKMKIGSSPIYGGFSDVWECDAQFSDGMTIAVAVKKFRAVRIDRNADENTVNGKLLKRLSKELEIWMSLKHPNITPLLGFVLLGDLCIISPWYSNGNVASYINRHPGTDRIKLVSDVARGLAYLHNRALPVIHGDMKPDNVLIDESGDAVIIDFGLSSVIEDEPTLATSFTSASLQDAGNARWMAPELLMEAGCTRSLSSDIYSFGCVALFIYTGELPFKGIPYIQIIYALIQGQKPVANRDDYPAVSSADVEWFYGLLVSCWDTDPRSRPSMGIVKERMRSCGPFQLAATLEIQLDSAEVAIASRRARVLWSERDAATIDATTKRIAPRSRSNSVDSSYATTVVAAGRREPNSLDHHVKCNGCHTNIVGRRFQCANCPSYPVSYNLCAECERSSFAIHPFPHVFLKFNRKVDHPVQTPHPLLPVIYEIPADGDFMDSIGNVANFVHEIAFCDLCMTPIRAVWYRCGHCNSDLCDFHEQTHNEDHSFIMIKAKASLNVLHQLWDLENPSSDAPLLQPVFDPRE